MATTFAVDGNNDLYLGTTGALAILTGLQATLQAAQQAAQAQAGEMLYAVDQGVPNFQTVWGGAPKIAQFDAGLRRALLAVPGVKGIRELIVTAGDNKLSYRATIETIYGTGAVNG